MRKRILILTTVLILIFPSTVFAARDKSTNAPEWAQNKSKQNMKLSQQKNSENKETKKEEKKEQILEKKKEKQETKEEKAKDKEDQGQDNLRGRQNAIARIAAKLNRMPEAAIKGLTNALASIRKWLGTDPSDKEEQE